MLNPNARVTVDKGMVEIDVVSPGMTVEVRDYNIEGSYDGADGLWTDEQGRPCVRYFAAAKDDAPSRPEDTSDLQRFADDLGKLTGLDVKLETDASRDGLHVLNIGAADFYFRADGHGYDGWGKRVGP